MRLNRREEMHLGVLFQLYDFLLPGILEEAAGVLEFCGTEKAVGDTVGQRFLPGQIRKLL